MVPKPCNSSVEIRYGLADEVIWDKLLDTSWSDGLPEKIFVVIRNGKMKRIKFTDEDGKALLYLGITGEPMMFRKYDDGPLESADLSNQLANVLVQGQSKDAIKTYELGLRMNGAEYIDLDTSDFKLVESVIDSAKIPDLLKAQLKKLCINAVEAPEEKAQKK